MQSHNTLITSVRNPLNSVLVVIVFLAVCVLVWNSFYTVTQGTRGVVYHFGEIRTVTAEGFHFKIPFVETVRQVDITTQKAESPATAGTHDLQSVKTEVSVNYHLQPEALIDTLTRVGPNIETKIIDPRIQEVVKAVVAKFSAENLLVQREMVKAQIEDGLRTQLAEYNVALEGIQITNFNFSQQFDHAIEAKQTAEQAALKAKNDLERIKVEAEQKVAMARANAEAIRIQAEAIRAQGGAEYVQLKAIEKWDGKLPSVQGGGMPFVNLGKLGGGTQAPAR